MIREERLGNLQEMEEEQLVLLLRNNNEEAFRYFVEKYQDSIYNLCLGFLRNEEDAEDVGQEIFVDAWQGIAGFRESAGLHTWLYRISVNKCLDFLRKKKRKKRFAWMVDIFGVDQNVVEDPVHPGVALERKEMATHLFKAIDQLPVNQKVAYTLHKIDGQSYEVVAAIMELSKASVESLMHRAKNNLRRILKKYYQTSFK